MEDSTLRPSKTLFFSDKNKRQTLLERVASGRSIKRSREHFWPRTQKHSHNASRKPSGEHFGLGPRNITKMAPERFLQSIFWHRTKKQGPKWLQFFFLERILAAPETKPKLFQTAFCRSFWPRTQTAFRGAQKTSLFSTEAPRIK